MLTGKYSGVLINQNQIPEAGAYVKLEGGWYYQTFRLPANYRLGSKPSQYRFPELSGFQLLVEIDDAATASLNYTLEYDVFGTGWVELESGTTTGAHADGEQVWLDVLFANPVSISNAISRSQFRIGFQKNQGVNRIWFANPNPLPSGKAFEGETARSWSYDFRILALSADSGIDFLGNPYRSVVVKSGLKNTSTTEGVNTGYWRSTPQPSQFAVVSNYFDVRDASADPVVIDGILLDPITPNIAFNVYYSNEGSADEATTTKEWEEKLWTHVPESYIATQRQTYVFPTPVKASFVKIEYSYLQPQSYNPGDFQTPVTYKKYPIWVADYFLAQMKLPEFIAKRVGVSYDALNFAYNYFLDDLNQRPAEPATATPEQASSLGEFFNKSDAAELVDPTTLGKINLILNTFTNPPGAQGDPGTLLGNHVSKGAFDQTNYPVEATASQSASNLLSVSSLNREKIVFEQSMPVMFFFLTCRHAYKELTAKFEHNRAYFAAINEIAFIRHQYTTASDGSLYIESGGDTVNVDVNDFVINDDGTWTTY